MSMFAASEGSRRERYQALCTLCPGVAEAMTHWWDESLGDYAAHLLRPVETDAPSPAAYAMLRSELESIAAQQLAPDDARDALAQFDAVRVIQTADHVQSLLDPTTFANALVMRMGLARTQQRYLFTHASSTVTMRTRGWTGPGYLNLDDARVNVFGWSNGALRRTSVGASRKQVQFAWAVDSGQVTGPASRLLQEIRAAQVDQVHASVEDAFLAGNTDLWRRWEPADGVQPLLTDGRLAARLVAGHLETGAPELAGLLFDPGVREQLARLRRPDRNNLNSRALPPSTDFFWGVRAERVRAMTLSSGWLREAGVADGAACRFEPDALAVALRRGELMPDLLMIMLVLAVLPGARVLGGPSQAIYLRIVADFVRRVLGVPVATPVDGWIAGALELTGHPLDLLGDIKGAGPLAELAKQYADLPLREAVGELDLFAYIKEWLDDMDGVSSER